MIRLSAAILVLAFATPLGGQDPAGADPEGQAVVVGETITVRSEILGEDRRIHVQLPAGLEAAGRLAEALEQSEEAVRRAEAVAHPRLDAFRRRLDALRQRLEGRGSE